MCSVAHDFSYEDISKKNLKFGKIRIRSDKYQIILNNLQEISKINLQELKDILFQVFGN